MDFGHPRSWDPRKRNLRKEIIQTLLVILGTLSFIILVPWLLGEAVLVVILIIGVLAVPIWCGVSDWLDEWHIQRANRKED